MNVVPVFPKASSALRSKREQALWDRLVRSRPQGFFDQPAQVLLAELCAHQALFELTSQQIDEEGAREEGTDLERMNALSTLRAREGRAVQALCTALRLSKQSVLSATTGRKAAEQGELNETPRPWEPGFVAPRKEQEVQADGSIATVTIEAG